jgi:hypothetical protein
MLKQLDALSALKPKIVVPAHGPVGDITALSTLTDYLLLARQKVRVMVQQGLPLEAVERQFNMHELRTGIAASTSRRRQRRSIANSRARARKWCPTPSARRW